MSRGSVMRFIALCSISATFCVTLSAFPSAIAADVVSVQTKQLLPQGGGTCTPLSAYGFTPYIYDGALHSFEFTVPDTSYVALAGTVGNTPIPFQFMTRHGNSPNFLRVHVDVQTTPIKGSLPLSVTLLSAKGTLCMSVVIMMTGSTPTSALPGSTPSPTTPPGVAPVTGVTTPGSSGTVTPPPTYATPRYTTPSGVVTPTGTSAVDAGTSSISLASIQNRIVESCVTAGGALRLWIILLAVYLAIVAIAVLAQTPSLQRYSKGQRVASILIPLVLLLGFWYFAESCRTTPWALLAVILIGLGGLIALYWDDSRLAPYTSALKNGEKKPEQKTTPTPPVSRPIITPPPANTK